MNRIENQESRENSDQEEKQEEEKEEERFRTCDGSHELVKENEIDHQINEIANYLI